MKEIIARLMIERDELSEKINKIDLFLFNSPDKVSSTQKDLLFIQLQTMKTYYHILDIRISDLKRNK